MRTSPRPRSHIHLCPHTRRRGQGTARRRILDPRSRLRASALRYSAIARDCAPRSPSIAPPCAWLEGIQPSADWRESPANRPCPPVQPCQLAIISQQSRQPTRRERHRCRPGGQSPMRIGSQAARSGEDRPQERPTAGMWRPPNPAAEAAVGRAAARPPQTRDPPFGLCSATVAALACGRWYLHGRVMPAQLAGGSMCVLCCGMLCVCFA